jgi:hypothetical protein
MVKLKSAVPMNLEDLQTDDAWRSLFRDERHPLGGPCAARSLESLSTELQRLESENILVRATGNGLAMGFGGIRELDLSQLSLSSTKLAEADEAGGV